MTVDKNFKEASLRGKDSKSTASDNGNQQEEELDKEPFEDDNIHVPPPPILNKKLVVVLDSSDVNQGCAGGSKRPAEKDERNVTSHPKMAKTSCDGKGHASTMPVAALEPCETATTASNAGDAATMYPPAIFRTPPSLPAEQSPIAWSNNVQPQPPASNFGREPLCSTMVADEQETIPGHRYDTTAHHAEIESHGQGITRHVQIYSSASSPSIYQDPTVNRGMQPIRPIPRPPRPSTRIGQRPPSPVPWEVVPSTPQRMPTAEFGYQPEGRILAVNVQNNVRGGYRISTGQQMHIDGHDVMYRRHNANGQMQEDSGIFSYPNAERANTRHQTTGQNAHGTQQLNGQRPHAVGDAYNFQEDSRNQFRQQHQQTQRHQHPQHYPHRHHNQQEYHQHYHQKHKQSPQHHNQQTNAGRHQLQQPDRESNVAEGPRVLPNALDHERDRQLRHGGPNTHDRPLPLLHDLLPQHANASPTLHEISSEIGPSSGMEAVIRHGLDETHQASDDLSGAIDLGLDNFGDALVDDEPYVMTEMSARSEENHDNIRGPADLSISRPQQGQVVDTTSSYGAEGKYI